MTCQTEQLDLAMLTEKLIPGTLYRIKGKENIWKYALITYQTDNKKEVRALSPKKNIVKMSIKDIVWLVKEIDDIYFEIVQCV